MSSPSLGLPLGRVQWATPAASPWTGSGAIFPGVGTAVIVQETDPEGWRQEASRRTQGSVACPATVSQCAATWVMSVSISTPLGAAVETQRPNFGICGEEEAALDPCQIAAVPMAERRVLGEQPTHLNQHRLNRHCDFAAGSRPGLQSEPT